MWPSTRLPSAYQTAPLSHPCPTATPPSSLSARQSTPTPRRPPRKSRRSCTERSGRPSSSRTTCSSPSSRTTCGSGSPASPGSRADDQRERLDTLLRTDSRLKRTLLGVVFGGLTVDEVAFALDHEAEVRRRVTALLAERVRSQTGAVAALAA